LDRVLRETLHRGHAARKRWVSPELDPTYSHEIYNLTVCQRSTRFRIIPARDGRLPETVHGRSREWRSAAAARNRSLGRHGNRSPDTRTRPRRASLHALRRRMPEPDARTRRPTIA